MGNEDRYEALQQSTKREKKKQKSTKRMTGVDEDFLEVFANSERGLVTATALSRNRSMTDLEMV